MVDIIRPNFGTVWAASGEKLSPTEIKIQGGWIQEMMPYQYQNFLQNRVDNAITYILQKGVPEWDASQEYTANKSVVTYSGQLYMALTTNTNVLPIVTASWKKLTVTLGVNGALPVAFGGTGATNAADARTNLGIGSAATVNLPTTNGMVVKLADNSLVARSITGTTGYITVTNPDGVSGSPTINVGANVAKTDADAAWTTTSSIRLPAGATSEQGVATPGRVRFNLETNEFQGAYNDGWGVLSKPVIASQISIVDVGGYYSSNNVEEALQEAASIDDSGMIKPLDSYVKETRSIVDALEVRTDELEKNTVRFQSYVQLRVYSGSATVADVTSTGLAGRFIVSTDDVTSPDDGGTLIVSADGRRWIRTGIERIQASWFGVATGVADVSDPMEKCLLAGRRLGKGIDLPGDGFLTHTKPIVFRSGDDVIGQGEGRTAFQKTTNLKSGLPPLLAPEAAGAEGITDVYDVDACMIVVPDAAGQYARNITLKGFYSESRQASRSVYGFYAPRICLSNFKDLAFSSQTAIFMKNTWMVAWERVRGGRASVGWAVVGDHLTSEGLAGFPAGGTSNSFRACWAHDCAEAGWSFDGLCYSAMIGCGVDNVHTNSTNQARGYSFQNCRGIVLDACGAEGITGTWLYVDKSIVSLNGCTAYWMNLDAAKVAAITNPFAVLDVVNGSSVTLDNCSLQYDGTATKVMPYFISDASRVQLLGGTKLPITGLLFGVGGLGDSASALYDATRETIRAKVRFQVAGGAVTIVRATPGVTVVRNGVGDFTVSVPTSETVFNDLVPIAMSDQFAITTTAFGPGVHRFTTRNVSGAPADPENVSWVCA